jgi:ABC-type protease/lipase transport system fused ATPase/permease subunit
MDALQKKKRAIFALTYFPLFLGYLYLTLSYLGTVVDDSPLVLYFLSYFFILAYVENQTRKAALKRREKMLQEKNNTSA